VAFLAKEHRIESAGSAVGLDEQDVCRHLLASRSRRLVGSRVPSCPGGTRRTNTTDRTVAKVLLTFAAGTMRWRHNRRAGRLRTKQHAVEVTCEQIERAGIGHATGNLEQFTAGDLRIAVVQISPGQELTFELSGVPVMDSAGLGALIGALPRPRELGAEAVVCSPGRRCTARSNWWGCPGWQAQAAGGGSHQVPAGVGRPTWYRRALEIRRRSRSEAPPQTPCSMWLARAYSKHGARTGHLSHICWAIWTPTPSLGKKIAGDSLRQSAEPIQPVSSWTSCDEVIWLAHLRPGAQPSPSRAGFGDSGARGFVPRYLRCK
jgi:anti-anti-sigma regulatory factor